MQTGRFVNKLENDVLAFYQTDHAEELLKPANLQEVWDLSKEGVGVHRKIFPNDMAITHTIITETQDSNGRILYNNDTVIIKFDASDADLILELLDSELHFTDRIKRYQQNNGDNLRNPLPEVQL